MTTIADSRPWASSKQQHVINWLEMPSPPPFDTHTRPRSTSPPDYTYPTPHILVERAPVQRRKSNTYKKWPHGVVQGGIILDMIEYLRTDSKDIPTDQDLALWLENNYVRPFARISRLEGLVVRDARETTVLVYAHERYSKVFPMPEGSRLPPQRLWVPGLEPTELPQVCEDVISFIEGIAPREPVEKYEMYKTFAVQTGKSLGMWKDLMGWTREIREAPKPRVDLARQTLPEKLLVQGLAARRGASEGRIPEKRVSEIQIFSNRADRRRKLNDGGKLTVSQRKLSETFTNATLARQSMSLSSPPDTPGTLIDVARLVAPFQLSWSSPLVVEDDRQSIVRPDRKRIGIIEGRVRGELKIRKEALSYSSPTRASMDNDAPLSISSDGESIDEAVSDSNAEVMDESEDETDYEQNNDGTRRLSADNESGSVDGESEGNASTDSESPSVSVKSESDDGDEGSEYSDVMGLSE